MERISTLAGFYYIKKKLCYNEIYNDEITKSIVYLKLLMIGKEDRVIFNSESYLKIS